MYIFGGALFTMGMSQAGYQLWMWLSSGSWPSFSLLSMLLELGFYRPYFSSHLVQIVSDRLLSSELSLTMLTIGAIVLFCRPVAEVVMERRAAALVELGRQQIATSKGASSLPTWTRMDFRHTS